MSEVSAGSPDERIYTRRVENLSESVSRGMAGERHREFSVSDSTIRGTMRLSTLGGSRSWLDLPPREGVHEAGKMARVRGCDGHDVAALFERPRLCGEDHIHVEFPLRCGGQTALRASAHSLAAVSMASVVSGSYPKTRFKESRRSICRRASRRKRARRCS